VVQFIASRQVFLDEVAGKVQIATALLDSNAARAKQQQLFDVLHGDASSGIASGFEEEVPQQITTHTPSSTQKYQGVKSPEFQGKPSPLQGINPMESKAVDFSKSLLNRAHSIHLKLVFGCILHKPT
jgi:hypothetical protein